VRPPVIVAYFTKKSNATNMKNWIYLLLLPLVVFSCRKDVEEITVTDTNYQPPVVEVSGSILGLVLDERGEPLPDAMVRLGSEVSITNAGGIYRFDNTTLNASGTYVTVSKAGYFHGSKRFYPQNNTTTTVDIQLLPLRTIGTISGETGGSISFEGASIELPAAGVVDAQNRIYTGSIQVAAHWLNPTADNLDRIMPGNLEGIAADGRQVGMATYGMLAVELLSEGGEELQVAPGQQANLTFPVPTELRGLAPATIPLWHFDEALGLWVEEGQATLQGEAYVGAVSHFSFWNCDVPYPLIRLSGRLVNLNGAPAGGKTISIFAEGIGRTGYGVTAANGTFTGLVPANAPLVLSVTNACPDFVIAELGPFSEDTDVGDIYIGDESQMHITGYIVDCEGNGIEGALVRLSWADGYAAMLTYDQGFFHFDGYICEATEITVEAYDAGTLNQIEPVTLPFDPAVRILEFGEIAACDNPLSEFLQNEVNGQSALFLDPTLGTFPVDSLFTDTIYSIAAESPGPDSASWYSIYLTVPQAGVGNLQR
jgi:protocatechuate 3,4-dioxygenase beta subunit